MTYSLISVDGVTMVVANRVAIHKIDTKNDIICSIHIDIDRHVQISVRQLFRHGVIWNYQDEGYMMHMYVNVEEICPFDSSAMKILLTAVELCGAVIVKRSVFDKSGNECVVKNLLGYF